MFEITLLILLGSNSEPPLILLFRSVCDTVGLFLFVIKILDAYVRHQGVVFIHYVLAGKGKGAGGAPNPAGHNAL